MEQQMNKQQLLKRRLWRTVMFYSLLLVLILGVLLVIHSAKKPLGSWLEQYQDSQYQNTADEIYNLLFAEPDWALLYDMAGIKNTAFEGKSQYVAYMQATVGDGKLSYTELPTGLQPHRLYSIRHQGKEIATFTMTPKENGGWTLGNIELFFERTRAVTVILPTDSMVYLNKVPVGEEYTTLSVHTLVEEYLEEGLHGYRYKKQTVTGLLVQPEITVLDDYGRPVELTQDPETGIYHAPIPTSEPITDEEYQRVLEATKADALFCLNLISITELRQHFDTTGQAYQDLIALEKEPTSIAEYRINEESIQIFDYYRYSDDLFSVRAQLDVICTDENGTQTTVQTDVSYFFRPNSAGNEMVVQRFHVDLQQQITVETTPSEEP